MDWFLYDREIYHEIVKQYDGVLGIFQSRSCSGLFRKCLEGSDISFGFPYSYFLIAAFLINSPT